jgi:hypothetical protein
MSFSLDSFFESIRPQLKSLLREVLDEAQREHSNGKSPEQGFTEGQAAEELGMSRSALQDLRKAGKISSDYRGPKRCHMYRASTLAKFQAGEQEQPA